MTDTAPMNTPSTPSISLPSTRRQFATTMALGGLGMMSSRLSASAQPTSTWTVAVLGHTGQGNYGHGMDTLWLNIPSTKVIAVSDPDEKGRTEASQRLGLAGEGTAFADYRELLATTKPDLVSIGPRHIHQHRDMILAACAQGVKGIYIEKPFVRDLVEADEVIAACAASGTKLAIAHRNRYHPVLPVIRQLIQDGAIGKWQEIRARGKEDARGGALDLWVLGSHLFNLIHYFAGAPISCSAQLKTKGKLVTPSDVVEGAEGVGPLAGDEVHARFTMENGITAYFDSIKDHMVKEASFGIQLIGNEGIIDLRIDEEPLAHHVAGSPVRPFTEAKAWQAISTQGIGQPETYPDIRPRVIQHQEAIYDLIAAIEEQRPTLCSEHDGRVVVEMTLAVFESHLQHGAAVTLPLSKRVNPLSQPS